MKVKHTHEFELDVKVNHLPNGDVELRLMDVDSDGGEFHYPKLVDDESRGDLLALIDADQVPEGWTDEQIADAWFHSPYGVA